MEVPLYFAHHPFFKWSDDRSSEEVLKLGGVYFLFHFGFCTRVGKTGRFAKRFDTYRITRSVPFDHAYVIPCEGKNRGALETLLINYFQPYYNDHHRDSFFIFNDSLDRPAAKALKLAKSVCVYEVDVGTVNFDEALSTPPIRPMYYYHFVAAVNQCERRAYAKTLF